MICSWITLNQSNIYQANKKKKSETSKQLWAAD